MLRKLGRGLAAAFLLIIGGNAAQAQVVVSQVYGGGGNTGATLRSDFIELHNNGTTAVSLTGWSVQYASSTGTTWSRTNLSGSIAAGGYFLIKQADGAGGTVNLPTPDVTGTISMSGTAGKVILVNNQTTLTGACPTGASIIDTVGFGTGTNCSETAPTPAPSNTLAVLRASNGCTDTGNNSSDFATGTPNPRNTASPVSVCGATSPVLGINDVSVFEGDAGTTTATFTVNLSIPAGAGGVSFDIATADGTATAGSDYVASALTGQTIAAGNSSATFSVTINGDTTTEGNETFFVNITNVTGATVGDAQGQGTIQNDDVAIVQIHDIQGSGLTSPLNGAVVTTEGIVTAQKFNNGFFLQTADANADADPNTSQGIFVFTSTAPPATAAVGNRVRVTGTVTEFTPSTNLNQLSITEIVSVTSIQVLSTGNPLPAPVVLTSVDFNAASTPGTAEKYEGMRATIASGRVVAASDGNITESSATSSTTGVFHVTLSGDIGVYRPFREPGIGIMDVFPIPGGKTPPRFDTNQERLMVRSRGQVGASPMALDVDTWITDMTGVLDYFSGTWALLPDAGSGTATGGKTPIEVAEPLNEDVTIGAFNLLRFFDEVNDSNGGPTLTAAALDKRLTKTSLAICDYLKAPDILGVVEVENLRVLGLLADRINSTCARAPQYVPYLVQGNDVGGINVGFLVSNRSLGLTNRVEVLEVTQFGRNTLFVNPDSSTSLLNDRPPLLLRAIVHAENGATYPVTVIVNHLRSLNGLDDTGPGSSGWPSEGDRVRNKRGQQAMFLADLVHQRQQANPGERIVLLGDFNAFEFNDGYVDVMGIVRGEETAEPNVISYFDSPITRPLIDGSELTVNPDGVYSYVFEGNAQTLDHIVINEPVVMDAADIRVEHARINADFGVHHFGVAGNAIRVSDHDPVRVAIAVPEFRSADLVASASAIAADVDLGNPARFAAVLTNDGPSDATSVSITMTFDALVTPSVTPSGLPPNDNWTCAAPVQNANSTSITCTSPILTADGSAGFEVDIPTDVALANRSLRMDVTVSSAVHDPANANNQASASVNVLAFADMEVSASGPAAPIVVGDTIAFIVDVHNAGPQAAPFASAAFVFDALIVPTVTAPAGWTCAAPVQDPTTTTVTCTIPSLAHQASGQFNISIPSNGPQQGDWTLQMAAAVSSQYPDNDSSDNTAIAIAQIRVFTDLDAILTTSTPVINPGQTALLTSFLTNNGPASVANVTGTFTFDALVSPTITVPAGWTCAAPTQTATSTSVICNTANLAAGARPQFGISFLAGADLANRSVQVTAAMTAAITDAFPDNNQVSTVINVRSVPEADLVAAVIVSTPTVTVGGTATYIVTIVNEGRAQTSPATASFVFDALVTPTINAPAGWSCAAPTQDATSTTVVCSSASLSIGQVAELLASFPAVNGLAGRTVQLTVTVTSDLIDPAPANNTSSGSVAIRGAADLSVAVATSTPTLPVGGTAAYTTTLTNSGPTGALFVNLTLSFDALVTPTVTVPSPIWTCAAPTQTATTTTVVCSSFSGVPVGSGTFGASFVAGAALGGRTVRLTASVSANTFDPVPGNNQASAAVQILSSADLSIRFMGRSERGGVFLLPVTNAGPNAAQAPVTVTFTGNTALANVTVIPPLSGGWTCTNSGTTSSFTVTCRSLTPLGPGTTEYFGMVVLGRGTRSVTITAAVSSATTDPNPGNNSVSQTLRSAGLLSECRHRYCQR